MIALPDKIGKYKIVSLVARGGMGAVYKALHPTLKRHVIIKKLTIRGNAAITERFKREAQILLDLNNPHIVHFYDYFKEGSAHYIVLEFVDGLSLDKLLKRKTRFSGEMALLIFYDACLALKYAHDHGIVHRDIKPGNILISRRGEVKLADFGIASGGEDEESSDLTSSGVTLGTPSYMPPEQFSDSSTVDKRADIYAMGVMLYEMVTGVKPFPGAFSPETLASIQRGKYPSPGRLAPGLPPVVCRLLRKMIRPDPDKRFQDMAPVIRILKRFLSRYNTHQIRTVMVKNMLTDQVAEPQFLPRNRLLLKISSAILAAVLFAGVVFFAWREGLIHRFLLRTWYTPVTVTMDLPNTVPASADQVFRVFFFLNDADSIPEVPGTQRTLDFVDERPLLTRIVDGEVSTPGGKLVRPLAARPVWLKSGAYRVKITMGPRIWWRSLVVDKDDETVHIDFGRVVQRSIRLSTLALDARSGKRLSDAVFSVLYKRDWVPIESLDREVLTSGTVWKIRAWAEGYVPEIFSLKIEWFQDELDISATLVPAEK
jgi:serine/threonine-protein kinase